MTPATPSARVASSTGATRSLRIYIVENHDDTRFMLRYLLEQSGHDVVGESATMRDALRELPDADCDVLLSDIGLPDGDGRELLRRLEVARRPYAIAMSGFGMASDVERSQQAGYRHHLVKPVDPRVLEELLEHVATGRTDGHAPHRHAEGRG